MLFRRSIPVMILVGASLLSAQEASLIAPIVQLQEPVRAATKAKLTGTVVDASGAFIAGATVLVRSAAGLVQETTHTDNRGAFAFPNIPNGIYQIFVSVLGFQAKELPLVIGTNEAPLRIALSVTALAQRLTCRAGRMTLPASRIPPPRERSAQREIRIVPSFVRERSWRRFRA